MGSLRRVTRVEIPHPDEAATIVGTLEQVEPDQLTQGRKIALILHGTMGHKDYLYQRRLAQRLPFDSFRFDFRGNHESSGKWRQGNVVGDAIDIQVVVNYLKQTYGYSIELLVGHSLGSLASFNWICHTNDGQNLPAFINVSGRYRMKVSDSAKTWREAVQERGYHEITISVAKKPATFRIYPDDLDNFANWDTSFVWDRFPAATDVLSIHGLSDATVPPFDALIYAKVLSARPAGTHSLHLMEGADHNFIGHHDEVVDSIIEWWGLRQRGGLKTGIWIPTSTKLDIPGVRL
ncbi:hypothetical protein AMATHDRAFT_73061 [Amanita thiersii Skay4041]|uniref:AB hydrolase-1 domain-containing protein n=1 Tax=Amanita thiersii Skay4041 TaxID=703135 RepID=A0A2A9NZL8_9AGAR|nr:hypothetical protein AMATHDRAFT_73061 [Amanita thiersii Skay4041]